MVPFLVLLSAFPPLSTDMYLPAIPTMVKDLGTDITVANLTLVLFFIFFATFLLLWGTISDKYGRKPILLIGTGLYVTASIFCFLSASILQLIVFRVFQAIGGAAPGAVALAIVRDRFNKDEREKLFAIISTLITVFPIISPLIGSAILLVAPWRVIFLVLAGMGIFAFIACLFISETNTNPIHGTIFKTIGALPRVIAIPGFALPLFLFALTSFPIFVFIGSAPNIYIQQFGLSEQIFSLFFAGNAVITMTGPSLYIFLHKRFPMSRIVNYAFLLPVISGILLLLFGNNGPFSFGFLVVIAGISATLLRPPGMNLMISLVEKEAGTASSLINFSFMLAGSLAMQFISLDWSNRIMVIGVIYILFGSICFTLWKRVRTKLQLA